MACRPGRSLWIESSSSAELTHTGVAWAYVHGSSGEPVSRSRPALRWSSSGRTRAQFPVGRPYTSGWLAPRGARRGSGHSAPPVRVAARAGDPRISRTPLARCGRDGSCLGLRLPGCNGERGKGSGSYRQVGDEKRGLSRADSVREYRRLGVRVKKPLYVGVQWPGAVTRRDQRHALGFVLNPGP